MIDRDTIINTLLGAFLLIVLCLYIAAIGSLFLLALIALQWLMHRFFLQTSLPFLAILAIWAAMATWYSIQHAREGRRKNVFLQLVSIPLLVSPGSLIPLQQSKRLEHIEKSVCTGFQSL